MDPPPGAPERIGPYRIVAKLGEGGMGTVWKGFDEDLRRHVALKVLSPLLASDPESRQRFLREARAAAVLSHPHVAQVYQIGEEGGRPYIAMEHVDGVSLEDMLQSQGRLAPARALSYVLQVVDGLEAAWRKSIVHRDVKPANVLAHDDGYAKIVDFGLSKVYGGDKSLTQSGMVMGTPRYMSPEQGEGKPLDFRSDIYSLGATLYHLLVGSPPYDADTPVSVIVKHITSPVPSLASIDPSIPAPVCRVIERMLQKRPEDRHQSYEDLRQELREALGHLSSAPTLALPARASATTVAVAPVDAGATSRTVALRPPASRPGRRAVVAIVALLAILGAVAVVTARRAPRSGATAPPAGASPDAPAPPSRPPAEATATPAGASTVAPLATATPAPPAATPTPSPEPAPPATPDRAVAGATAGAGSRGLRPSSEPVRPTATPAAHGTTPAPEASMSPQPRAEALAERALHRIAAGDLAGGRDGLRELDGCLASGACAPALRASAACVRGTLAARDGDAKGALEGYRDALRLTTDPTSPVLALREGKAAWTPLGGVIATELARFDLAPEQSALLVPDFDSGAEQLAFAGKVAAVPGAGQKPEPLAVAALERVMTRFPGDLESYARASTALAVGHLRRHVAAPAIAHLEPAIAHMRSRGASWRDLNDQLFLLATAFAETRDLARVRDTLKEAFDVSQDDADPVPLVTPDGTVRHVPLEDARRALLGRQAGGLPRPAEGRPLRPRDRSREPGKRP